MGDRPGNNGELNAEQVARLLAAAQERPELPPFEWDLPEPMPRWEVQATAPLVASPEPRERIAAAADPAEFPPMRRRIRDRYIAVRFAGVARSAADLEDVKRVIKAARLAFEEERPETALELLELAIEQRRQEASLWLARLEILYLLRSRGRFTAFARAFRDAFPKHAAWPEVARLGRALAPEEGLFGTLGQARPDHYGPWPDLPNWILAPWDLTSEVRAGDLHRAMAVGRPILIA